jgi:hypothetical protein
MLKALGLKPSMEKKKTKTKKQKNLMTFQTNEN